MPSFITTPSTILPFHSKPILAKCSFNKRIFPLPSSRSTPIMQTNNFSPNDELDDEDDDATMGTPFESGSPFGLQTPPLSPSERIYLDGAKNNKEYMARVTEIARKKHQQKYAQPVQTPDAYVESLSRQNKPPVEGGYGGPRIDPADEYMQNLGRTYRERKGIEDDPLPENLRSSTAPAGPGVDPSLIAKPTDSVAELQEKMRAIEAEIDHVSQGMSKSQQGSVAQDVKEQLDEMAKMRQLQHDEDDDADITLEEGVRQVAELQRQIREAAGLEDDSHPETVPVNSETDSEPELESKQESQPESNSEASNPRESLQDSQVGQEPGTVDKQIAFLENYLSKLQKEAAEDSEADAEESVPQEPKRDISEEIQTTMSTVAEQISKMPSERKPFQGLEDTPGEMTAEEKMAAFEQLRRRAATAQPSSEFADPLNVTLPERNTMGGTDDGDEPSPESEAEYDSFESSFGDKSLLIEEIETEVRAYSRDVKAMLQKHETRLQVLLTRLRTL